LGQSPILSLALDLKPGAHPGKVDLWAPGHKKALYLDGARALVELPLSVGTLVVQ
jgi:hypothetical protein